MGWALLTLSTPTDTLDLRAASFETTGFAVQEIDLGYPAVRESITVLPSNDGDYDTTTLFGPRVVSLKGVTIPLNGMSMSVVMDQLMPYLDPKARPVLTYQFDDTDPPKQLILRASQFSGPVNSPSRRMFTAQWKCPDPIALSSVQNMIQIAPLQSPQPGRTYPRVFPQVYPSSLSAAGIGYVNTGGTYGPWPLLRIFGPVTDPKVEWLDPVTLSHIGPQVKFIGISVLTGDYLEVDTKAATVTLNGSAGANRYSFVDFPNTIMGPLAAGPNALRFTGSTVALPAALQVLWKDAWLL